MKINVDGLISSKVDKDVGFSLAKIHKILSNAVNLLFTAFTVDNTNVDVAGNLHLVGSGTLGYGTGSGGSVTQATSKSTGVTLNKATGQITMHNQELAADAIAEFIVSNSVVGGNDCVVCHTGNFSSYHVELRNITSGAFVVRVTNVSAVALSEALTINFAVIKGSAS